MPELPEVETIKRDLERDILGLIIEDVCVYDPRVIRGLPPKDFIQKINENKISAVTRRGKAIILAFADKGFVVIQPKMTGQLIYGEDLKTVQKLKETKVTFKLSDGNTLNYNDQRLFGKLSFVTDLNDHGYLKTIGIEPLSSDFSEGWLKESLGKRKTPMKMFLMNQTFLAGIGNIYASEILFKAGIYPKKPANKLTRAQIQRLYRSTVEILEEAIAFRGSSMRNYRDSRGEKGRFMNRIKVYAREGQPCFLCGQPVIRIVQGARSTFFCKNCQR